MQSSPDEFCFCIELFHLNLTYNLPPLQPLTHDCLPQTELIEIPLILNFCSFIASISSIVPQLSIPPIMSTFGHYFKVTT